VTPGFENMFIGHNTWFHYQAMMRIFKHYHLNVNDPATSAHSLSFSSYPGPFLSIYCMVADSFCSIISSIHV